MSSMSSNNIFAKTKKTGRICSADGARRGVNIYTCADPECGKDVFVRRGDVNIAHFCHHSEQEKGSCPGRNGGETREHYDSKHLIASHIKQFRFITNRCPRCGDESVYSCTSVQVEGLIHGTRRIADILVRDSRTMKHIAAIEILHTHRVDEDKRQDLQNANIVLIEVTTSKINELKQLADDGLICAVDTEDCSSDKCYKCEKECNRIQQLDAWRISEEKYDIQWTNKCCIMQQLYRKRISWVVQYQQERLAELYHEYRLLTEQEPEVMDIVRFKRWIWEWDNLEYSKRKRKLDSIFSGGGFSSCVEWVNCCKRYCKYRDYCLTESASKSWRTINLDIPNGIHVLGAGTNMYHI